MFAQNQIKRALSQPPAIAYVAGLLTEGGEFVHRTELADFLCEEFDFLGRARGIDGHLAAVKLFQQLHDGACAAGFVAVNGTQHQQAGARGEAAVAVGAQMGRPVGGGRGSRGAVHGAFVVSLAGTDGGR